ncbi:PREDICTED: cytosolic 5'-nucleotidase 1B isoform X5 [Condylura cristata]|uniref:cytosolic 5'-nucleotidase 1B isoform X5 n=1 Tax=Condylura cristata TaxID=143302 RepID=UPI0003345202|nr:PREDICTED: cytosolic 5'-nucleotidase 1B isoform X5 [Condylura cristata]
MSQTSLKQKKKNDTGSRYSKDSVDSEKKKDSEKSGVRLNTQGSQELVPKTDSRGYLVRNQWSRTSRSPSVRAPSTDEGRSKTTTNKLPSSSATSRTSSTSPSQHESQKLLEQISPRTPPSQHTPPAPVDSCPPTPPEPQFQPTSRRGTKMNENTDTWTHGIMRDNRDKRDYPRTPPSEWKSYNPHRSLYPSSQVDSDCMSSDPAPRKKQQDVEEDEDEAYWSSVRTLYEKTPSCSRPPPPKPRHALTIAVSSRALFNMMDGTKIFEEEGLEKYMEYQLTNENVILTPGPAFRFVKALQHVNARLRELYPNDQDLFDIVLMTNNHAQVGVRLINSVNHYGLLIDRYCLTGGKSPIGYLKTYLTNLYLSSDCEKIQEAIHEGIAAATMFEGAKEIAYCDSQLRVAFDGDAILFTEETDHNAKDHGVDKFFQHENACETKTLAQVPLKSFLEELGRLQKKFYAKDERLLCPIRTYLVTARSAASSGARVLKTLRRWGLEIDEALFLAGAPKGPILMKIRPHIFFDDHMFHIEGHKK